MRNSKKYLLLACIIASTFLGQAQETTTPEVELIEDKQPKRWLLYAQNNTDEEQEAFLLVQGEGFRRSADRPVIKKVPPKGKVLMITLIPLKGVTPTYTKIFTHETNLQTINKRKGENDQPYVNIRPLRENELTIFSETACEKCTYLINFLNRNHINYRLLDVNTHHKVKDFMFDHLKTSTYKGGLVDLPVIMFEGRKHWSIADIEKFIKKYDWSGLKKR